MNVTEELLQTLSEEFDQLTIERHNEGAAEYGDFNFLKVDLPVFIYEELADGVNYLRYLYIRLRLIEELARERGIDLSAGLSQEGGGANPIPYGPASFTPSKEISGLLPFEE